MIKLKLCIVLINKKMRSGPRNPNATKASFGIEMTLIYLKSPGAPQVGTQPNLRFSHAKP